MDIDLDQDPDITMDQDPLCCGRGFSEQIKVAPNLLMSAHNSPHFNHQVLDDSTKLEIRSKLDEAVIAIIEEGHPVQV